MPEKMEESVLVAVLGAKITSSASYMGGILSKERIIAQQYYDGTPFGDELPGRSRVVSRDVQEAVDSMLPAILKCFTATNTIGTFDPRRPDAEEAAKQATDYVNWIVWTRNAGFLLFYSWFKDALLKKLGIIKTWWDEQLDTERETYNGLSKRELIMLSLDPEVEIVSAEQSAPEQPNSASAPPPPATEQGEPQGALPAPTAPTLDRQSVGQGAPSTPAPTYDVVCRRTKDSSHVKIMPIPPEEFLYEPWTINLHDSAFLCHRVQKRATDLIEMGFSPEQIERLGTDSSTTLDLNQEKIERFKDESAYPFRADSVVDESMRMIMLNECYVRADWDGDGIAELRQVMLVGESSFEILEWKDGTKANIEIDRQPFQVLTPIIIPHKLTGNSIADQTQDIQEIKSALWRGLLNSIYLQNEPMMGAVDGKANLDDLLNRRAGGIVRVKSPDALIPIPTTPVSDAAFQAIEYADAVRESRTGVQRFKSTLTKDSINPFADTATGVNAVEDASNDRLQLIARVFADTGVTDLFKRVLELVCKHQKKPEIIRLREKFVEMDPREWTTEMDFTHAVGLGTGDRDKQLMHAMGLGPVFQQIIQLQGGLSGPIITAENLYNYCTYLGEKSSLGGVVDKLFTDPKNAPPAPPPPPNPEMIKAQAQTQAVQAKAQLQAQQGQQKMQLEREMHGMEMQQERERGAVEIQVQQQKAAAEMEADRQKLGAELQLHAAEGQQRMALERQQMTNDMMTQRAQADHGMAIQRDQSKAKIETGKAEFAEKKRQGAYKPQPKPKGKK